MSARPSSPPGPDPNDVADVRYPNTARIWNYQLGGKDSFAIDREASEGS
jgi:hypothetical protein